MVLYTSSLIEYLRDSNDLTAVAALAAVAMITMVPLTVVKNAHCFTVGYGASVASMGIAILVAFRQQTVSLSTMLLAVAAVLYGLRLALFLLYRELSVPQMHRQTKEFDEQKMFLVLPMSVILSIMYAFQVSPILFAYRGNNRDEAIIPSATAVPLIGAVLSYMGLFMEAVADQHKLQFKRQKHVNYGHSRFASPTAGLYALCRHPNFAGEIAFWTGIYLGGMACNNKSIVAWCCGTFGWVTIASIMLGSTKRLEDKESKLYGGQPAYELWKKRVRYALVPTLPSRKV